MCEGCKAEGQYRPAPEILQTLLWAPPFFSILMRMQCPQGFYIQQQGSLGLAAECRQILPLETFSGVSAL